MRRSPVISICIPAYRKEFIEETLSSITRQLENNKLFEKIEICITDDNPKDNKIEIISTYKKRYKNIRYFANKKRAGMRKNLINAGLKARGEYIWFFSDDDKLKENAIIQVLKMIVKYDPDVLICNLDEYSRDMKKLVTANSLNINKDAFIHGRKALFDFLNTKFFYNIDWYTTYYSNLIINKNVYDLTYKLSKKYASALDLFPQSLGIFYSKNEYDIYIVSQPLIKYRNDNLSYGPKDRKKFLAYGDKVSSNHYKNIVEINNDVVSLEFKVKLALKTFMRKFRLYVLSPLFGY